MYILLSGCQNPDILRVIYFALKILDIVFTIVPIGLIVFLTIDLVKMIISSDDKQNKNMKLVVNRIIFSVLIFFAPTIVSAVMGLLGDAGVNVGEDYTMCIANANSSAIADFQYYQDIEDKAKEEQLKQELQDKLNESSDNYGEISTGGGTSGSTNSGDSNYNDNENSANQENDFSNNSSGNSSSGSASSGSNGSSNSGSGGSSNSGFGGSASSGGTESTGNLYKDLANKMIQVASNEIGTQEGENNSNKYGKELGINNQPWCAIFVTWVAKHTTVSGTNLFSGVIQKYNTIYNPYSAVNSIYTFSTSKNLKFYYSNYYGGSGYTPKKGDYIYFNWNKNWNKKIYPETFSEGQHVGIVEYVKDGYVYTIEGNTSSGTVARLSYNLDSGAIMGYGSWYQ